MNIHYKTDPEKQARYEDIVKKLMTTVKDRYGKGFDDAVHPNMIEQYARSVIRADELEEKIDNGEADKFIYDMLKAERNVQKDLLDRLKLTVRGIVGDTRSFKKEKTGEFKDFFKRRMEPFVEDDSDEIDTDNVQQE